MGKWIDGLTDLDEPPHVAEALAHEQPVPLVPPVTPVTPVTPKKTIVGNNASSLTLAAFATHGCELLREDLDHLRRYLPPDTARRNEAIRRYISTWQAAMALEPKEHCKQNAGRYAANIQLLRAANETRHTQERTP